MRRAPPVLLLVLGGCRQLLGFEDPVVADASELVTDVPPDAALSTEDGWASGTRLKLAWNDYRGVRADLSMFDPDLGVPCIAYAWADGKRYCAPRNFNPPFEGVGYLDAGCTQPVGYRFHSDCSLASAPIYLTQARQQPCVGYVRTKVFRRGALRTTPASLYVDHSGTCEPTDFPASSHDVYDLGEEVPTSAMVEMTETRIPLDGRVSRSDYRGTDGSSYAGGVHDTMLGVACSLNETGTCAPATGGSSGVFGDSACGSVLASVQAGCPAPRLGNRPTQPGCPTTTTRYFDVGAKRTQVPSLFQYSGMVCTPAFSSAMSDYYDTTTEISAATLPRAVDAPPAGSPIALVHYGTGAERARAANAYDYTHSTPCATLGGRCLPSNGVGTSRYYVDAGCSTARSFAITTGTVLGCAAPTPPELVVAQGGISPNCSTAYQVFRVGAKYTGPLYTGAPGACSSTTTSFDLHELGEQVPLVEFAVATPMRDE